MIIIEKNLKSFLLIKLPVLIRLKLSRALSTIANLLDKVAIKCLPSKHYVYKAKDNVYQSLTSTSMFSGNQYTNVFMCGVDWQHEFGETSCKTYASIEDVKENTKCWKSCGIVKATLKPIEVEWLEKQDLFNPKYLTEYKPGKKKNKAQRNKRNGPKTK